MRLFRHVVPAAAALAFVLSGCAQPNRSSNIPAAATPAPLAGQGSNQGTIVAIRPTGEGVGAAVAGVVTAGLARPAQPAAGGASVEFIVREDDGGEIAVVQPNAEGLRPGDRVAIARGADVRLSRLR